MYDVKEKHNSATKLRWPTEFGRRSNQIPLHVHLKKTTADGSPRPPPNDPPARTTVDAMSHCKNESVQKKPSFHPAPHPIPKFYALKQPQSTSISQNSQKFLENNFFENSQTLGPDQTSCVKKTQRRHPITVHTPSPLSHPPAPPVDNSTAPPRALERPLARPNTQNTQTSLAKPSKHSTTRDSQAILPAASIEHRRDRLLRTTQIKKKITLAPSAIQVFYANNELGMTKNIPRP